MKKAVIFDLDGTLTYTLKSICKSANLTLAEFGFPPIELDRFRYFVGNGSDELIRQCLLAVGDEHLVYFERAIEKYKEIFEQYCMYEVQPYEGINELLSQLKKRGILLAVNSNKPQDRTVDVVETIFGKGFFDCLIGQCSERERKPSADGIKTILQSFHMIKEEVLYIGDTSVDMMTGKNAGVFTIGALWGFRDRDELEAYHADAIVEKPLEILEYL